MFRFGLAFACLFAAAAAAAVSRAASPNPDDLVATPEIQVKARALVRQLGSENFIEREDAEKQLVQLGRFARPALNAGAASNPDPEIRFRCGQILPRATALDRKAKLETFLADTKGEYEHDLPAWKRFRAAVGSEWAVFGVKVWTDRELDAAARRVFTDLVSTTANRRLLILVDGSRIDLGDAVVWRRQELYDGRYTREGVEAVAPTLDDMTALLFAESLVGSSYISGRRTSISALMSGSGFTTAARGTDEKGKVYRAVAVAWLDSRNEAREMYTAIGIATSLELPEQALGLSARLLTTPAISPAWRTRGVNHLTLYGTQKHIRLLDQALTDTFVVSVVPRAPTDTEPEPAPYQVQIRDVALGIAIALAGQKPGDFGFVDRSGGFAEERRSFTSAGHYFPDNAARKAAFEKWEKWRKANPEG